MFDIPCIQLGYEMLLVWNEMWPSINPARPFSGIRCFSDDSMLFERYGR